MGLLDKLLSKKKTKEQFAKMAQNALEKGGASGLKHNSDDFSIRVESLNRTFYLDNAYRDYCQAETESDRTTRFAKYISSFLEAPSMPKDFASAKEHLMPIVRDPAYFSLTALKIRADGGNPAKALTAVKRIAPGLVAGVAFDTEKSIMNLSASTLDEWGAGLEETLKLATDHLRERTPETGFKQIAEGLYVSEFGDSYDSARLLLPDLLYRLKVNGDPIIFVPNRDQLWVTGSYYPAGIGVILKYGPDSHFNLGHNLSPNLYRLSEGALAQYLPEDPAQREAALAIQRRRSLMDYEQQTGYLKKIHEREKEDIFVASFKLFKRKDESTFSIGVWSNGVDTLLPRTDYIAFMVDHAKKESFKVSWEEAFPIVGCLMERVPDLEPIRYRVTRFPDGPQLGLLRERVGHADP